MKQYEMIVDSLKDKFIELSQEHKAVKFQEECIFAKQALEKNNFLRSVAERNPESLKTAIYNVAMSGITLNPIHQRAWLIPRDGQICLDVGYRGMAWLAYQENAIDWVQAYVVRKNDSFKTPELVGERPVHNYNPFLDRGPIVGAYCVAKVGNDYLTHIVDLEYIEKVRGASEAYKAFKNGKIRTCPWVEYEEEMVKKTCVKQAYKLWPRKSQRLDVAVSSDNEAQGISFEDSEPEQIEEPQGPSRAEIAEEKDGVLSNILGLLGELTKGSSLNEKAMFLFNNTGCKTFDDLKKKKIEDLKKVLDRLEEMKNVQRFTR